MKKIDFEFGSHASTTKVEVDGEPILARYARVESQVHEFTEFRVEGIMPPNPTDPQAREVVFSGYLLDKEDLNTLRKLMLDVSNYINQAHDDGHESYPPMRELYATTQEFVAWLPHAK